MNIIVIAVASRVSGALSIYKQFLAHLSNHVGEDRYYIFVDPSMPQPKMDGVKYVHDDNHSMWHMIRWDERVLKRWMRETGIVPDRIVSLQNIGSSVKCRKLVYYHQPLPFYRKKWNPLKGAERQMFLYKHFYPLFVRRKLDVQTDIVVQIPFIKKGFVDCFGYDEQKVHVLFPDVESIDAQSVQRFPFEEGLFHFVYPAIGAPYKNHRVLVEAVDGLVKCHPELGEKVRFHFTLTSDEAGWLKALVGQRELNRQFVFEGRVPHEELLRMYKSSLAFCFPSTIETLGLPLLEAASFGLPILAADVDYAHEVMGDYSGVSFLSPDDTKAWSEAIASVCEQPRRYNPIKRRESSWPKFFELIKI